MWNTLYVPSDSPQERRGHSHLSWALYRSRVRSMRLLDRDAQLTNALIQLVHIKASLTIVLARKFKHRKSIFVGGESSIYGLIQVDQTALNHKHDQRRAWRIVRDNQRMGLTRGFIDKRSRFGNPVMLKVTPVTTHRVTAYRANVIVDAQLRSGKTLQNDAEAA